MYSNQRHELRQMFFSTWEKFKAEQALEPLEQHLVSLINQHPEYIADIEAVGHDPDRDYPPELGRSNPFLHLSLHMSLQEQVQTNRPAGIYEAYHHLLQKHHDQHQVEHLMMDCLAEILWQAQRAGTLPDEHDYLLRLQQLS